VGNAYHLAKELEERDQAETSTRGDESIIWKGMWSLQLPNAAKNFMSRACHDLLPTKDTLVRQKIILDPSCPLCGLEAETLYHILWECSSAMDVWGADASARVF
jgi:hypothetical protein